MPRENLINGISLVALRKESVDRNKNTKPSEQAKAVALRKESVDRNGTLSALIIGFSASLSARRAWIEMIMETPWCYLI